MTMGPGDFSKMERISAIPSVRRVEREGASQDLGQRGKREQPQKDAPEDETPQDIIELSVASPADLPLLTDRAVTVVRPPAPMSAAYSPAPPERHLDLEV